MSEFNDPESESSFLRKIMKIGCRGLQLTFHGQDARNHIHLQTFDQVDCVVSTSEELRCLSMHMHII